MFSVIVLTKNEEDRIKACLESIKWADELIVIDQGSSDRTLELVKKYTDKIFIKDNSDFSLRRNLGMEKATGNWVLYLDADERVLEPLKKEIEWVVTSKGQFSAYAISRKNVIFGQKVNYGPYKKDWVIRLFKKDHFKTWVGEVHEYGTFTGKLGYLKNSLLHLTHRDLDQFLQKAIDWSKIDAQLRINTHHPKMTRWRFIRIFLTEMWHQIVARRGFFDGTVGIIDSILQVFYFYMTYVRLWQMQQEKPLKKIYDEIDKKLIENNFKY